MRDTSNMPAGIWYDEYDISLFRKESSGSADTLYIRADIVEALAAALEEARDALNGAPNTIGLHSQIDSALNSYREASNDKA